jgi:hypothetical protein
LEGHGLVAGSFLGVGLPRQWEIVEGGRKALAAFEPSRRGAGKEGGMIEPTPTSGKRGVDGMGRYEAELTGEPARCQHCPDMLADERSFMCEDCAFKADTEVDDLREQLRGAVAALRKIASHDTLATQTRAGCRRVAREALASLNQPGGR